MGFYTAGDAKPRQPGRYTRESSFVTATVIVTAFVAVGLSFVGGCTAETSRTDANDAVDADAGDVTDDADTDEARDSSDASDEDDGGEDESDGGNGDNGNDGPQEPEEPDWVDCDCEHPDDKCSPVLCGRPGIACGEGEECPDGYTCRADLGVPPFCKCDGERDDCGPYCEEETDCFGSCDVDDGVCRERRGCNHPMECPKGMSCQSTEGESSSSRHCQETGDGKEGDSCSENLDCQSGLCREGECQEQCLSDDDCDSGKRCDEFVLYMEGWGTSANGCVDLSESNAACTVSCADNRRCRFDSCLPQWCLRGSDCENADCVYEGWFFGGECQQHSGDDDYVCKPDEYINLAGDACILPSRCWDDDDCGEPYECSTSGTCERDIDDEVPS